MIEQCESEQLATVLVNTATVVRCHSASYPSSVRGSSAVHTETIRIGISADDMCRAVI